ncbi:YbjQ family protein [Gammaproteobacteria bacterium]|nr:YbjQ family protein [Gammaproteobacteria bacterium]
MSSRKCSKCRAEYDSLRRGPYDDYCDDCLAEVRQQKEETEEEALIKKNKIDSLKITTTNHYPNYEVDEVLGVITSECVFGMNIFRDMFAGVRDIFGGRSDSTQKVLRDSRETCLYELKKEAYYLKADGVIGIDLDYSEFSGGGKSMLFLVASGTAVTFKK